MPKNFSAPILSRKEIAAKTFEVRFGTQGADFSFLAGQFVNIRLQDLVAPDYRAGIRSFSIASAPSSAAEYISIIFRESSSGFKQTLLSVPIGTSAHVMGPLGHFFLPPNSARPVVLVAGGIGVAPFLSIIRDACEKKLERDITLLYRNSRAESAVYLDELVNIQRINPRFHCRHVLHRFDKERLLDAIKDPWLADWYVCGPSGMVVHSQELLGELGVDPRAIQQEIFTGCLE